MPNIALVRDGEDRAAPQLGVRLYSPFHADVVNMTKDCPNCGLVNPFNAIRCDCSYQFGEQENGTGSKPTAIDTDENENLLKVSLATIFIGFILTALIMLLIDGVIIKIEYPYFWTQVLHYLLEPGVIVGSEYVSKKGLRMFLNSVKDPRLLKDLMFVARLNAVALGVKIVLFMIVMVFLDFNLGITDIDLMAIHYIGSLLSG
jgi:hypothetical protein